ncbi:HAD family hydrolase [Chromobacterium alticapitis]|uniref:HAD family hydrolase n=1 Tax=Chromobacterium alticapitis TaxID=2073169 RepID=A0A2S5DE60_9NEIS|nr:HAD family hydrolase [Chromobacterium alticapitis]POZ61257.1 HAD family hydrolase [Chromobacterium alticapitis]
MTLPQAVFFDLDNTLVHRDASIDLYVERFWRDFGHAIRSSGAMQVAAVIKRQDNGGYLPAGSPFVSIKQAVSHGLKTEIDWRQEIEQEALLRHWERYNAVCTAAMPGAEAAMAFLVENRVRAGVISNGSHRTRLEKVACLPFASAIELIVSSESAGIKKPAAEIFHQAAQTLGAQAAACWYVGDHPRNDVLGAARAGMTPLWLSGFHAWPEGEAMVYRQISSLVRLAEAMAEQ